MSDAQEDAPEDGSAEGDDSGVIANLRKKAKEADRLAGEHQALLRENVMLKAGVPESNIGKMFASSFDGELTPEAVKDAWSAIATELAPATPAPTDGTVTEPEPVEEAPPMISPEEQESQRVQDLLTGGTPPDATPQQHPGILGAKEYHDMVRQGSTRQDAAAQYFGTLIAAHNAGDERAIAERRGGLNAI